MKALQYVFVVVVLLLAQACDTIPIVPNNVGIGESSVIEDLEPGDPRLDLVVEASDKFEFVFDAIGGVVTQPNLAGTSAVTTLDFGGSPETVVVSLLFGSSGAPLAAALVVPNGNPDRAYLAMAGPGLTGTYLDAGGNVLTLLLTNQWLFTGADYSTGVSKGPVTAALGQVMDRFVAANPTIMDIAIFIDGGTIRQSFASILTVQGYAGKGNGDYWTPEEIKASPDVAIRLMKAFSFSMEALLKAAGTCGVSVTESGDPIEDPSCTPS